MLKNDRVLIFDIESGIYKGPKENIKMPSPDHLSDATNKLLKEYEVEYLKKTNKKITLPRYVTIGEMDFETFTRGCYENPELAFTTDLKTKTFLLSYDGITEFLAYWNNVLQYLFTGNTLLMGHNVNYDINGILCACRRGDKNLLIDMTRDFLKENEGEYLAFPESVHDDKTFDIRVGKSHIRLIDTMNLSPIGCKSLRKYGERASSVYSTDYNKGTEYDYQYTIKRPEDIPPTSEELKYTDRDLQLTLFAGMWNVFLYREQLAGTGQRFNAQTFPFSATQRDMAVNDGLFALIKYPGKPSSERSRMYYTKKKRFRKFCANWGNPKSEREYNLFHNASTGGIITTNESYVNKIVENVGSMDFSSSYPSTSDFLFPRFNYDDYKTGDMPPQFFYWYIENIIKPMASELRSGKMVINSEAISERYYCGMKIGFVAKVRFRGISYHDFGEDLNGFRYWLPVLPYKDFSEDANTEFFKTMRGKAVEHDEMEYYATHVGLIIIYAFYDIESVEFLDGITYDMRPLHDVIHSRFYGGLVGKQNAKGIKKALERGELSDDDYIENTGSVWLKGKTHDEIIEDSKYYYNSWKVPLNACYGATYRLLVRDGRAINEKDEYITVDGTYNPVGNVAYPTGVYIAIYGQFKIAHAILWAISKRLPILYVHTDSLKIQGLTPELVAEYNTLLHPPTFERDGEPISFDDSFGIGKMDFEGSHDFAVSLGNMRIVSWDRENGFDITLSGLNEAKAFPKKKINNMDIFEFTETFLKDGKRYAIDEDTESGKTITDYTLANLEIPGFGVSMQSIIESEFILNNPNSSRFRWNREVYNAWVGTYHGADYYAKKRFYIPYRKEGVNNDNIE